MDSLFNSDLKEKIKESIFLKEEIIFSIEKIKQYISVMTFGLLLRTILSMFSKIETAGMKIQTLLFFFVHTIFSFICFYRILPVIEKKIIANSIIPCEILKNKNTIELISITFLIFGSCGILVFLISPIQDDFLKGVSLTITSNVLQHFCIMMIRNTKKSTIIHLGYIVFTYFLLSNSKNNLEFLGKLIIGNAFGFLTEFQNHKDSKRKSDKFVEEIYDKNNIFKQFLKEISDPIFLKSINDNTFIFRNQSFIDMKISESEFTVEGKELFNEKLISLSGKIFNLLKIPFETTYQNYLINENFYLDTENQSKIFLILAMKIKKNYKEYFGIYIKDITKTVIKVQKNTTEIITNRQFCSISHELKTPLNQSIGISINLKHNIKDEINKNYIRLLLSSLYKLSLKIDEFLEYGKYIENQLKEDMHPVKIALLFKELMKMNYCSISSQNPLFLFEISSTLENIEILLDFRKIIIILQGIITKFIEAANSKQIFIKANLKNSKLIIILQNLLKIKEDTILSPQKFKKFRLDFSKLNNDNEIFSEVRVNISEIITPILCKLIHVESVYVNNINYEEYQISKDINVLIGKNGENSNSIENILGTDYGHIEEFDVIRPKRKFIRNSVEANQLVKLKSDMNLLVNNNLNNSRFNKLILVVDDNQMNRFPIVEIIKTFSLNYEEAENGLIAFEKYIKIRENLTMKILILLDLNMPVMDGIECCLKIRKFENEKQISHIPIIAITSYDSEIEKEKCFKAGMNEFFKKPIKKIQLKELIDKYLM